MKADPTALRIVYGIGEKMININHHSADHDQEGPPPPIKIECPRYKRRNNEMERQVNKWTTHFRINLSKQLKSRSPSTAYASVEYRNPTLMFVF